MISIIQLYEEYIRDYEELFNDNHFPEKIILSEFFDKYYDLFAINGFVDAIDCQNMSKVKFYSECVYQYCRNGLLKAGKRI